MLTTIFYNVKRFFLAPINTPRKIIFSDECSNLAVFFCVSSIFLEVHGSEFRGSRVHRKSEQLIREL